MPRTTVQKMIGLISIDTSFTNPNATGLRAAPASGQIAPNPAPSTAQSST